MSKRLKSKEIKSKERTRGKTNLKTTDSGLDQERVARTKRNLSATARESCEEGFEGIWDFSCHRLVDRPLVGPYKSHQ